MSIGEKLRELREARGLTQREVANKVFITVSMYSGIETGVKQPSLNVALALAHFFETDVETLAGVRE